MRKYAVIGAILVLLASAIALSYYLANSNLLFYATGVFWYGVITGFSFTAHPQIVTDTLFPAGSIYGADYVWNGLENCYELSQLYQVQA